MSEPIDDVPNKRWMERTLRKLRFVEWDRYVVGNWDGEPSVSVYGWIEREDAYKDFVLLIFWPTGDGLYFTTSSDKYTKEIHQTLFDEPMEEHNSCHRVENGFNVDNAVQL